MKKALSRKSNTRVVPVASYVMNVCDYNHKQVDDLDKLIKKALRDKGMHGRQASDEKLYLKVEDKERGLRSMKDVQEDTKGRVACYMAYQNSPWIEAAWESEAAKDGKCVCRGLNDILGKYAVGMCICREGMYDGDMLVL